MSLCCWSKKNADSLTTVGAAIIQFLAFSSFPCCLHAACKVFLASVGGWILTDVVLRLPGELGAFWRVFKSVSQSPKLDISQKFCCLWNVLVPSRQSRWLRKIHNYSGKGVEQREPLWSVLTRIYFCSFFQLIFYLSGLLWSHFNLRDDQMGSTAAEITNAAMLHSEWQRSGIEQQALSLDDTFFSKHS